MIETKQLQYLVVCADLQSFSKAADILYTSQPNVSKVIRTLEEELGFALFERQNRGIRLTKKGSQVYEYACKAMENVNQLAAYARIDEGKNSLSRVIRVPGCRRALRNFIRSIKTGRSAFRS